MTKNDLAQGIFTVDSFLDPTACASLIARSEQTGYTIATLADGAVYSDTRSNDRVIVDDRSLADDLFEQARPFLPTEIDGCPLRRFNERFRFYRYEGDQTFRPHRDGSYLDFEAAEESMITFLIYLNDVESGGETNFYHSIEQAVSGSPHISVRPAAAGAALAFVHRCWHEGAPVQAGTEIRAADRRHVRNLRVDRQVTLDETKCRRQARSLLLSPNRVERIVTPKVDASVRDRG